MSKERITADMNMLEMIVTMSEGNPGAATCLMQMLQEDPMAMLDILWFDSMEIYGSKIYMLWNDCCGRSMTKLKETIKYLKTGVVTKEQIHENLNRGYAKTFI